MLIPLGLCCWREMTISYLVGGILADHCCHLSHFPQTCYRRRLTGVDGSTGVWKAVRMPEIPLVTNAIACSPLPCVRLPVQNLTLKFRLLKFSQFLILYLEASYEIYKNLHRTKISHYTVVLTCGGSACLLVSTGESESAQCCSTHYRSMA